MGGLDELMWLVNFYKTTKALIKTFIEASTEALLDNCHYTLDAIIIQLLIRQIIYTSCT